MLPLTSCVKSWQRNVLWSSSPLPANSLALMSFIILGRSRSLPTTLLSHAMMRPFAIIALTMSSNLSPLLFRTMLLEPKTTVNGWLPAQLRLICTSRCSAPYYGFVPASEVDLLVEILQLSSFLCTCCFSREGKGLSLPTAAALLSTISSIPNDRSGASIAVFPGTGVFICDPAPVPQEGEPAIACWLYTPARLPPPPPKAFCTIVSTLSPGDPSIGVISSF